MLLVNRSQEVLEGLADRYVELVQRAAVGGGHQVNARANVGDVVEVLRPAAVDVEERDLPLDLGRGPPGRTAQRSC